MTWRRWVLGALGVLAFALLVGGWLLARAYRPAALKDRIVAYLSDQLESEVTLEALDGSFFPRITLSGGGLVVRSKGRTDVPPLLSIERFEIRASLLAVLRQPRHVSEVRLQGLNVHIPPNDADANGGSDHPPAGRASARDDAGDSTHDVIVDRFEAPDTVLTLIPRNPNKPAKVFTIHHLVMDSVGRDRTIPYIAVLSNPVPKGEIEASGTFGPWDVGRPSNTPVTGKYTFSNADLNTINGLAGILSSTGAFEGPLNRIQVEGTTDTPQFQVDAGGQPVPLTTRFKAVVDGSNGDTILEQVDATFLDTDLTARGAVIGIEGVRGRRIEVDVDMENGRVEDLLKLAVDAPDPILRGAVRLQAKLVIPPGPAKVLDKMDLQGEFGLMQATFTDPAVQSKIVGLSRRGQGRDKDEPMGEVVSNLKGQFAIGNSNARFTNLAFDVPGAGVRLSGSYGIRSQQVDFHGRLIMNATLSQAAGGGLKSFFLKAVDPFFKKDGAGTVLPIKITGSRTSPRFGLELFGADRKEK